VQQDRVSLDGLTTGGVEAPLLQFQSRASRASLSAISSASTHQKTVQLGTVEPPVLALLKHWSKPAVVVAALLLAILLTSQPITPAYGALALAALLISRQLFSPLRLLSVNSSLLPKLEIARLLLEWSAVLGLLLFFGLALRLWGLFPRNLLLSWCTLTPLALLLGDYCSARALAGSRAAHDRHIIIGANEVGVELARRVSQGLGTGTFMGFFDFRSPERLPEHTRDQFAGQCKDVAEFVRRHAVNAIYIALPMSNAPRIEEMLNEFRDTTASIYFVPDIFAFDLVQARCVEINGIPMLAICDTPFHGMNAIKKRGIDIVLSTLALLLAWPLMLAIAIAVKLSSPGPLLFKQRRSGLHGDDILVYKFRTMTVCEDGPVVVQAARQDQRVTAVGRFLRRSSLDELPQLFNVFQGKMSFVGPRPHAVAHNEMYRKLISGYMIRHKVRPGLTGWAQAHGLRGETTTVEQMRLRVQYDLYYLRNWSLWLDIKILFKTVLIVFRGGNAY
jgi:putative colanic acid biosysnthesis UDP-glucose lipid carrier transferase